MGLTPDGMVKLAELLSQLRPGFLPQPVFIEVARLTVTPVVEVVPLRSARFGPQVLLLERDQKDPTWPGMLHTPGSVVRATDREGSYTDALSRILLDELHAIATKSNPRFVGNFLHKVRRGMESAIVYYVEIAGEPRTGDFYDISSLPPNVVDTQLGFIEAAAETFSRSSNG